MILRTRRYLEDGEPPRPVLQLSFSLATMKGIEGFVQCCWALRIHRTIATHGQVRITTPSSGSEGNERLLWQWWPPENPHWGMLSLHFLDLLSGQPMTLIVPNCHILPRLFKVLRILLCILRQYPPRLEELQLALSFASQLFAGRAPAVPPFYNPRNGNATVQRI